MDIATERRGRGPTTHCQCGGERFDGFGAERVGAAKEIGEAQQIIGRAAFEFRELCHRTELESERKTNGKESDARDGDSNDAIHGKAEKELCAQNG